MCYFIKKITQFLQKRTILTKIFKVYEGKIAIFPVSDEQIDPEAKAIQPVNVEILTIAREIGHHQKFAAARAVADGFHVRKGPEQVLAVFFGKFFGFAAHAAENFNPRNDVVAVEPVVEGIFATAEQYGAVTLLGKDAVEIVYPKRDAAPSEECKRDKEAGANRNDKPVPIIRQRGHITQNNRLLSKVTEQAIPTHSKQVQRHKVAQEFFALEAGFRVFTTENKEYHIDNGDQADKPPVFELC